MTFSEWVIRLKRLKYAWTIYASPTLNEIHFVPTDEIEIYTNSPIFQKREKAHYIWDVTKEIWTKERSPLDATPLTKAERVLYAKN